jgi:hypothetical protein
MVDAGPKDVRVIAGELAPDKSAKARIAPGVLSGDGQLALR